jgi:hypothetical protein
MKTLQELLDEVKESKFGKMSEGKISHMITGINRTQELNSDESKMRERGKRLGQTVGRYNMTDYSREMSKVATVCPRCGTIGPLSNIRQHHFDNCKRVVGYSDNLIIENNKKGMSAFQISKDSNVSYAQTKSIIRKYKKISS